MLFDKPELSHSIYMDSDTINDLKQFIAATISQQTSDLRQDIDRIDKKVEGLDRKIDDRTDEILTTIGESTETRFEVIEEDQKQMNIRLTKLEAAYTAHWID